LPGKELQVSSPITFSGFNNIDFNVVVNSLMQQASLPLNSLQTQQKSLQSQIGGLNTLASQVAALRSAAGELRKSANLAMLAGTSSNDQAVKVAVDSTASVARYDVIVNELARAQVTVSASGSPDANTTIVASGGSITIGGVAVAITGDSTLQQIASAINGTAGIGVTAAVVRTGASSYRLALTSTQQGAANAFTITNGLSGGTGLSFTDTDLDGVSGNSAADNAVSATDASLLINNIPVTGSSNRFEDVLPGVTLTVLKKDPSATVSVDVATDASDLKDKIETFITAYNDMVKFVGDQRTAAAKGDAASIGRQPLLRQLYNGMRSALVGAHGTGTLTRLAEAGIEFTSSGQLKLNGSVFDAAITAGSADVRELFGGTAGAFPDVEALLDTYQQVDGFIPAGKKRLEAQIATMGSQIDAMQRRLAIQRESLQRQFAEADSIMARLNGQASSLSNLGSSFGTLKS
jgi:flagellar hook-associated protein 2